MTRTSGGWRGPGSSSLICLTPEMTENLGLAGAVEKEHVPMGYTWLGLLTAWQPGHKSVLKMGESGECVKR